MRLLVVHQGLDAPPRWDEATYFDNGNMILAAPLSYDNIFRPPLYPAFLAGLFSIAGSGRFAIGVVQALLCAVTGAFLYTLTRRLFARRSIALLAVLGASVYVELVTVSRMYLTETLFITFLVGAFTLLYQLTRAPRLRTAFFAGLLCILAALTREVLIHYVLLAVPVWCALALGWRRALRVVPVFLVGVLLLLTPWVARNYAVSGRFILIGNSGEFTLLRDNVRAEHRANLAAGKKTSLKQILRKELRKVPVNERGGYVARRVVGVIWNYPRQWLQLHSTEIRQFWARVSPGDRTINLKIGDSLPEQGLRLFLDYSPILLILIATVGIFAARDDSFKLLFMLFVLYTLAISFVTHFQARFRMPMFALAMPYAAFGLTSLATTLKHPQTLRAVLTRPRTYVGLVVFTLFVIASIYEGM